MRPTSQLQVFPTVEIAGVGGGLFVYNASRTALLESIAAAATTDPVLGVAVPAGTATYNSHGRVVNLLSTANNAFFQYADIGAAQGNLILSVASAAGNDPVDGTPYPAGLTGTNPAFGNSMNVVGDQLLLHAPVYTFDAQVFGAAAPTSADRPLLRVNAPEQTTASHLQMLLGGASPDASKAAQLLIGIVAGAALLTPVTQAPVEVQGSIATTGTVEAIVGGALEPWHDGALTNPPFQAFGSGFNTPGYRFAAIDGGRVKLRGLVGVNANSGASATIFTLPAGYRPAKAQSFTTAAAMSGLTIANTTTIQVTAGGAVLAVPTGINGNAIGLDGVEIELD